jgi:hypothetical protein
VRIPYQVVLVLILEEIPEYREKKKKQQQQKEKKKDQ